MKARSAHNKGKRMEKYALDYIRENVDAHAYTPKGSGNGLEKGDIYMPNHDVVIEVKNQATLKIADWWEQTTDQAHNQIPLLVVRNPRKAETKETWAIMHFEDICELLKTKNNSVEIELTEPGYSLRQAVAEAERGVKRIKKELDI